MTRPYLPAPRRVRYPDWIPPPSPGEGTALRIAVIGTGYVGLVTATCFAESGNDVVGMDADQRKVDLLVSGKIPIYEPGLQELVQRNRREERLRFTTDLAQAVRQAELIFIAVGTPQGSDGSADLGNLWALADALAE